MATNDKHCQTFTVKSDFYDAKDYSAMYDETVPVENARGIDSPSSDEEVVRATMAKFNPPVRHTARHDFDSESESDSEPEKFIHDVSAEDESPDRSKPPPSDRTTEVPKPAHNLQMDSPIKSKIKPKRQDSSNSETDSGDIEAELGASAAGSGRRRAAGVVIPAEGAYDPKQFLDLKVPPEIDNIFQYIMKFAKRTSVKIFCAETIDPTFGEIASNITFNLLTGRAAVLIKFSVFVCLLFINIIYILRKKNE